MIVHIAIFAFVFAVMLALVNWIPDLLIVFRERYQADVFQTTRELNRFFINIKPAHMITVFTILALLLFFATGSWILAGALCVAGLFAPRVILSIYKDIRSSQFETQLMDALVLMGNSMKSGLDIAAGIERVSTNLKPPISEEFGLVMNGYRLGTPLEAGLMDLTTRIRSRTLETVVYAIIIQRETGGNILKTFDQLVLNIREENKLQKKVSAMTSQGRAQIFVLACLPWVMAGFFYLVAPEMMAPAIANPWGQLIVLFLLVWEMIGIVVTKHVTTIEV
jgi:tight adherence protein B